MNVAVTGGRGKLGQAVVAELLEHGHRVVVVDAVPYPDAPCPSVMADLTDYGQTVSALTGVDDRHQGVEAVVHLAALPAPGLATNERVFANNLLSTFHVFSAARALGIKQVVWASSETLLGIPFDQPPPYIPLDEEYPARPESAYALAKHLEETMAVEICRWEPEMTMIGLRFSNVMASEDYAEFPSFDADPWLRRWNLWGYIDRRDGAQAVRLALAYREPGVEVFVIANADTVMSRSSAELVADCFPGVPVTKDLGEHETLLGIDKARRLLGYAPVHGWRDQVG